MLGPASVTSLQFESIVHSMNDVELDDCVDLLGTFDISIELARHIWSRIKDKVCPFKNIHTHKLN